MINRNPRVLTTLAVLAVFWLMALSFGLAQFVDQLAVTDARLAGHAVVAILAAFLIAGLAIGKAVYPMLRVDGHEPEARSLTADKAYEGFEDEVLGTPRQY